MGGSAPKQEPRKVMRSILSPDYAGGGERAERRRRLAALQQLQQTGRDSTLLTAGGKLGG